MRDCRFDCARRSGKAALLDSGELSIRLSFGYRAPCRWPYPMRVASSLGLPEVDASEQTADKQKEHEMRAFIFAMVVIATPIASAAMAAAEPIPEYEGCRNASVHGLWDCR